MTTDLHPRIIELMASRICHDLVSPVGAINNGVELIRDMGDEAMEDAMGLISASATQAATRLKCFRLAYGAAGTDRNIGITEIQDAFSGWVNASHIQIEYEQNLGLKFSMPPRGFMKCLLNAMILAEECGRGEGKVVVAALEGNKGVRVTLTGPRVAFRDGAEAALKGETTPDDLDPRAVHAYLTGAFPRIFELKLEFSAKPEQIEFRVLV